MEGDQGKVARNHVFEPTFYIEIVSIRNVSARKSSESNWNV